MDGIERFNVVFFSDSAYSCGIEVESWVFLKDVICLLLLNGQELIDFIVDFPEGLRQSTLLVDFNSMYSGKTSE